MVSPGLGRQGDLRGEPHSCLFWVLVCFASAPHPINHPSRACRRFHHRWSRGVAGARSPGRDDRSCGVVHQRLGEQTYNLLGARRWTQGSGSMPSGSYGVHEPLVDDFVVAKAQAISARARRACPPARQRQGLSPSGLLCCGRCGKAYMGMSANGNGGRYHCYGGLVRLIAGAWELSGVPTLLLPGLGQVDLGVVVGGVAGRLGRPVDQV